MISQEISLRPREKKSLEIMKTNVPQIIETLNHPGKVIETQVLSSSNHNA